ncbi:hypothetical protein B296_00030508 [Ensete ventricosum]|uniref:Retrotransposon gag domain-containing protein n=1 Tax=Ensete ventricosum TaxID=4639 RepID=A0A426ZYE9_ENSVE|nr:hypothetical protein B296_00030508 [Ensete ventricosum]
MIKSADGLVWHVRRHNVLGFPNDSAWGCSRMRRPKLTIASLLGIRQKEDEPLGSYLAHFTKEIRGIPDAHPKKGLYPSRSLKEITFKSESEYPNHDDALVITTRIANVYVKRIMINTGSSANILYFDSFLKFGMTNWDLTPMTSTLTRFTRDAITLIGIATLQMTFGDEPRTKTLMVLFLLSVPSISKRALSLAKGFQSRVSPSEVSVSPKCFQSQALPSEPLPLPKGFQSQASPGGLSLDHSPSELFTSPEDFPLIARWLHDNHVDFESIDSRVTQLYESNREIRKKIPPPPRRPESGNLLTSSLSSAPR